MTRFDVRNRPLRASILSVAFAAMTSACSSGSSDAVGSVGSSPNSADDAGDPNDAGANGDGSTTLADGGSAANDASRLVAMQATATSAAECVAIQPFYWEMGDQDSGATPTLFGSAGVDATTKAPIARTTQFGIASASKWIFAAYIIQKLDGVMDPVTKKFMHFQSGYTSFDDSSCAHSYGVNTVADCENIYCWTAKTGKAIVGCSLAQPSAATYANYDVTRNSDYTAADDGFFSYGGGHFQRYAVAAGAGVINPGDGDGSYGFDMSSDISVAGTPATNTKLSADILALLGLKLDPFLYSIPQLAGGVATDAASYATFLQNILNGNLKIKAFLGVDPVCTNPSTCAQAHYTPIPEESLHYSYGHWVEDDPAAENSDGAFDSAGAFGFYPWIDATKTYYGVISRAEQTGVDSSDSSVQNGYKSELCGRLIRKAFATGVAQK